MYHGQHGEPFIDIWNCQAAIAREVWNFNEKGERVGRNIYCTNVGDLEDELLDEIDRQGGAITMSGRMYCPPELAAKAKWPTPTSPQSS